MRVMRAAALAVTITVCSPIAVSAQAPRKPTCSALATVGGTRNGLCAGGSGATVPGADGRGPRRPIELITALSSTSETGSCTILATPTSGPGERALAFQQALDRINDVFDPLLRQGLLNDLWAGVLARLPGCAGVAPVEVAFAFVREIVPPGPDPWVAPGYAITGKPAFLETRTPTTTAVRYDTPLGPLEVTLRATRFAVDWGDRSTVDDGPFPAPGRPWPGGAARHTYTDAARYDVVVTQAWDADWRLAGETGTVNGLTSVGRLDAFEARQLQAVRNS